MKENDLGTHVAVFTFVENIARCTEGALKGTERGLQVICTNLARTVKFKKRNHICQLYLKVLSWGPQGGCKGVSGYYHALYENSYREKFSNRN